MNDNKYSHLIEKLNKYVHDNVSTTFVSPTKLGEQGGSLSLNNSNVYITNDIDFESLNDNQLCLVHTLLHRIYASGGTKDLTKINIEKLHEDIKNKINHFKFDRLDDNETKN